ncbi:MAG: DUF721 domain-containing protein [Legionella sp.]|nr:MAG: DUF721 domain-containing protein [Legionella sp.]
MRSISRCLNKQLAEICERSVQLEELSDKITHLLPPNLAAMCKVGSFAKGCLVLTTTDAVWASQLRYAIPELRDKLRSEAGMYQLSSIKINVIEPTIDYNKTKTTSGPSLTTKAKETIIRESQQCSYEPLKEALLHLADSDDALNQPKRLQSDD